MIRTLAAVAAGALETGKAMRDMPTTRMFAEAVPEALHLPCPNGDDPRLTPIVQIQRFYRFAHALALARGKDPDAPPFLKKVTVTR